MAEKQLRSEMMGNGEYYAIVTGASSGLGKALAEELARRGHGLLLASLPGTGLPEQSAALAARYNVTVHFVETDLTDMHAPEEIRRYAGEEKLNIDILVNNVGVGHGGEIGGYNDAAIGESVFLNMRCTTLMTNAFVEELKKREKAYILNIGSFGGFLPLPFKSIYSATKSYIYHFSLAIREELRGTGVSVSVAMPGPIVTNNRVRERIKEMGFVARSNLIEPEIAATYILDRMFRGREVIIPRRTVRFSYNIGVLLPYRLLMIITGRLFKGIR
jgi:short-subunit dehydrogenase